MTEQSITATDLAGIKYWKLPNGDLHREDGPAIEYPDGFAEWWLNGQRHRGNGPAIEWSDGHKEWWVKGQRHREDGPAIEHPNGTKEWYIGGKFIYREETND